MNPTFESVARFKKVDIIAHIVLFSISLVLAFTSRMSALALCIMAPLQVISCICWSVYYQSSGAPPYRSGTYIRRGFYFVLANIALGFIFPAYGFGILYLMIVVGPVMGTLYFVITCKEFRYYRDAKKPYFLL